MSEVLMSIMTTQADKIFGGTKHWEFRKALPRADENLSVVVYSSQTEKAIVGQFAVGRVLRCGLAELMEITGYSNDPKAVAWFQKYYGNRTACGALEVTNPILYETPLTLPDIRAVIPEFRPPQAFVYLKEGDALTTLINEVRRG